MKFVHDGDGRPAGDRAQIGPEVCRFGHVQAADRHLPELLVSRKLVEAKLSVKTTVLGCPPPLISSIGLAMLIKGLITITKVYACNLFITYLISLLTIL